MSSVPFIIVLLQSNLILDAKTWWANLWKSFADWIKSKINEVWNSVKWIATKVKNFIWVESPTKEWPLAIDQSIWWKNLVKAVAKWINEEKWTIEKEILDISKEMEEISNLWEKYKTISSVSRRRWTLRQKLDKTEFWTTEFSKIQKELRLLIRG